MEVISCEICNKKFSRKKSQILLAKKHYCSVECQSIGRRKGKTVSCCICSKKVYKKNKDLTNSKSKKNFCSINCSNIWLGSQNQGKRHPNWVNGRSSYKEILKRESSTHICNLCKEDDRRILIVHHIDRNRANNNVNNLTWLCHNCHYLAHHSDSERDRLANILKKHGDT